MSLGSLRSLKPGQQGGGFAGKRRGEGLSTVGPAPSPALLQRPRSLTPLEAAIQKQHARGAAEARGRSQSQHLPEWIVAGQRVGYLSSRGKVCEGFIDSVSLEKCEVKFVFAEDENIWKRVTFDTILSKTNPLRRLAVPGARSKGMTEMLNAAQESDIDKSIMLQRLVGDAAVQSVSGKGPGSNAGNSGSAAPEPGSDRGSDECSRSRSRSPRLASAGAGGQKQNHQLPEWVAVGKRIRYLSRSGRYCEVDIDSIDDKEVRIVFVDDRTVWKGIPFSMIHSDKNPLKPIVPEFQQSGRRIVDLEGSDCSSDGSVEIRPAPVRAIGPKPQGQLLPEWISVGQRVGYMSKSSGKLCQVEVAAVSMDEKTVKIIFVDNREVWKGIPFSMIFSSANPLRRL